MTVDLFQVTWSNMAAKPSFKVLKLACNWPYLQNLEIFCSIFFGEVQFSITQEEKKNTLIPLFDFRIQWNSFRLDSLVRSKAEVVTGSGPIGLGNPLNGYLYAVTQLL